MSVLSGLLRPEVERHLLTAEKEFIVQQIHRHWVTRLPGVGLVLLGVVLLGSMPFIRAGWALGLMAGVVAGCVGFWRIHSENMDRFVVTNVRVFRVHGVLNQQMASVPLVRLLDITMTRTFWGQLLNYGHFVFETAAQDQGLKRIAFVPDIEKCDLMLQTVIQRAGVRARAGDEVAEYSELRDSLAADPTRLSRLAGRLRRRGSAVDPNDLDGV
jgi:Bacterial PH domain